MTDSLQSIARIQIALRLEPKMVASIDEQPGKSRHAKIVELIDEALRERPLIA